MRVIFYYQTFQGLNDLMVQPCPITHIHLSSIHFGAVPQPYIHLNDNPPDAAVFNTVWAELDTLTSKYNVTLVLMLGGAGGAFQVLFSDFATYYPMLRDLLHRHPNIAGVDLDVEEVTTIANLKRLMLQLRADFPHLFFTMAPLASSLQSDTPGMGGFIYKTLLSDPDLGPLVQYVNGQFYSAYDVASYDQVINNKYPADRVVMGMESGQISTDQAVQVVTALKHKYNNFGGVFVWEKWNAAPDWADRMAALSAKK
jgi:hypothetical protein